MSNIDTKAVADALGVNPEDIAARHRAVQDALRWFTFDHLPLGQPRQVSALCADLAGEMVIRIRADDPELTRGLSRLLEAKDALVRAAIAAQREAGKAAEEAARDEDDPAERADVLRMRREMAREAGDDFAGRPRDSMEDGE